MTNTKTKPKDVGPPAPSVMEAGRRLFDVVGITGVSLAECRAHVRQAVEGTLRLTLRRTASGDRSEDGKQVRATVRFTLEGRFEGEESEGSALLIDAVFNAFYEIPSDHQASKEALDFFANANGTFNLWPYWREFVQSTAARMGVAGLIVPTYRVEEVFTGPGTVDRTQKAQEDGSREADPAQPQ